MTGESASTEEDNTKHCEISNVIKLAVRSDDDDGLKKETKFTDDMGALLLNYEASNKLMPLYIQTRRNVKERLTTKGDNEPPKQRVNEMEQEEPKDEYRNMIDFLNDF